MSKPTKEMKEKFVKEELLQFVRELAADLFVQFPIGPETPEHIVKEYHRAENILDALRFVIENSGENISSITIEEAECKFRFIQRGSNLLERRERFLFLLRSVGVEVKED